MAKLTRKELAQNDLEALLLDEKFLRFLSTIRLIAGTETVAYGPADRHLHFVEGRRSLWCDMLRMAEALQPEALLSVLTAELKASKESSDGRRKYNRLDTDPDGSGPEPGSGGFEFLDYGPSAGAED